MIKNNGAAGRPRATGELLKIRRASLERFRAKVRVKKTRQNKNLASAAAIVLALGMAGAARAETAPVGVPDKSFPESVTSTSDGTLYVGSFNHGGVTKISAGKAEQLVKPGAADSRSTLGVLADEKSGTLYVCSNDISAMGVAGPSDVKGAWLKTFDLKSGAPKGSFALSDPKSFCNDIVVGADGTAYVSDSFAPFVYSLKPGSTGLATFATDPQLAPAKDGVGLDGIAIGADGNLYVTTFIPAKLFKIEMKDGKAGAVTELKPSRPLDHVGRAAARDWRDDSARDRMARNGAAAPKTLFDSVGVWPKWDSISPAARAESHLASKLAESSLKLGLTATSAAAAPRTGGTRRRDSYSSSVAAGCSPGR
ncbi:hypothetical protein [Bradyrhizobium sp. USDA 3256]